VIQQKKQLISRRNKVLDLNTWKNESLESASSAIASLSNEVSDIGFPFTSATRLRVFFACSILPLLKFHLTDSGIIQK
jgi:hypothetical protein